MKIFCISFIIFLDQFQLQNDSGVHVKPTDENTSKSSQDWEKIFSSQAEEEEVAFHFFFYLKYNFPCVN